MPTPIVLSSHVVSDVVSGSYTVASLSPELQVCQVRTPCIPSSTSCSIKGPVPGSCWTGEDNLTPQSHDIWGFGICRLAHTEELEQPNPREKSAPHQSCGLQEGAIVVSNPEAIVRRHKAQLSTSTHSLPFYFSITHLPSEIGFLPHDC